MVAVTTIVTAFALSSPPPWPMSISVADSGVIEVGACFPGQDVAAVAIGTARGRGAIRSAVALRTDSTGDRVPLVADSEGRWSHPADRLECVQVRYDLAALARPPMATAGSFDPRDVLISPVGADPRPAILRVASAPDRRLWVPWPASGTAAYRVPESAFRLPGHAFVLPSFVERHVEAAGTRVDVALAAGFSTLDLDGVERWLRRALAAHEGLFDPFPRAEWSLAVLPAAPGTAGRGSPVVFGTSSRGGGHHIVAWIPADVVPRSPLFFSRRMPSRFPTGAASDVCDTSSRSFGYAPGVSRHLPCPRGESLRPARSEKQRAPSALLGEWVLVHELFHLAQPWVRESWFSEGLATYYGEVLRARRGDLTPVELWAALTGGFRRGASVGGESSLEGEEQHMVARRTFWRVYWGGAAIALLADVALRQSGSSSLDVGVRALASQLELTDARAAMAAMAAATGDDSFARVAASALASRELPDVASVLASLGVRDGPDGVSLDDSAPLAEIRRAIERGDPPRRPWDGLGTPSERRWQVGAGHSGRTGRRLALPAGGKNKVVANKSVATSRGPK